MTIFSVAGIDYSMTSPAITTFKGAQWNFNKCKFFYMTSSKKTILKEGKLQGSEVEKYENDQERQSNLAFWASDVLILEGVECSVIEGYSYGSVGRVFQIAENTGHLKHELRNQSINFEIVAPTAIKKFATCKGNANKQLLEEFFEKETNMGLRKKLHQTDKQFNPSSDIIDSYYMAKYCFDMMKKKEEET